MISSPAGTAEREFVFAGSPFELIFFIVVFHFLLTPPDHRNHDFSSITPRKILNVATVIRYFRSFWHMARDGGMLNMFLEEANNKRMHLLTFIRTKDPGTLFRAAVVGGQFGFGTTKR